MIHKRCLGCGYILDGLPENRCPECGREFDPNDADSYLQRQYSGTPYLIAAVLGIVAMAIPLGVAEAHDLDYLKPRIWMMLIIAPLMPVGLATSALVLITTIRLLRRPREMVRRRGAAIAALILSSAVIACFIGALVWPNKHG
jgi:MFS family permease